MFLIGAYANTFILSNHLCIIFSAEAPQFSPNKTLKYLRLKCVRVSARVRG